MKPETIQTLSSSAIILVVAIVLLVLGVMLGLRFAKQISKQPPEPLPKQPREAPSKILAVLSAPAIFAVLAIAVVVLSGVFINRTYNFSDEFGIGLLVVGAIVALMTVLFILAAGLNTMNLTNRDQPLGLPEGSIRAMIALVLILVFILFGIYLFNKVGFGSSVFLQTMTEKPTLVETSGSPFRIVDRGGGTNGFDIYLVKDVMTDAKTLAQQLITTIGTLVVAVAGFYFGSSATSSATAAAQAAAGGGPPKIDSLNEKEGEKGKRLDVIISGSGLLTAKAVRFVRGNETMDATNVLSDANRVTCQLVPDKEPGEPWSVVVENQDGKTATLKNVFTIKAPGSASNLGATTLTIQPPQPAEGTMGQQLDVTILGTGLTSTKAVRLTRGSEKMDATNIRLETDKVVCTLTIDKGQPGEKWDVIVENQDGRTVKLEQAFAIKSPGDPSTAAAKTQTALTATAQSAAAGGPPSLEIVDPPDGKKGENLHFALRGMGLTMATKAVRLVRGAETMVGTHITSNPTEISFDVSIDKDPDGKWDVIVDTEDGKTATLKNAFTIKSPDDPSTAAAKTQAALTAAAAETTTIRGG